MASLEEIRKFRRVFFIVFRRAGAILIFRRRICDLFGRNVELGEGVLVKVVGRVACDMFDEFCDGAVGVLRLNVYTCQGKERHYEYQTYTVCKSKDGKDVAHA